MSKLLFIIAGVILALAVACAGSTPAPRATTVPPAPTATTVPQVPTPTPMVTREWDLQGIEVEGNRVTVTLRVFAGIDVGVSVGGATHSHVNEAIQILEFIFENVAAGEHPVVIRDIVGHIETTSATVEAAVQLTPEIPEWLAEWLLELDSGKVEFEPVSITRYWWLDEIVYYVLPQCCDQFSDLLDADGNLIGHPDGGITGRGDGVTFFTLAGQKGEIIWQMR